MCIIFDRELEVNSNKTDCKTPDIYPSFEEIETKNRININILKQEITDHINSEVRRFWRELDAIKNG